MKLTNKIIFLILWTIAGFRVQAQNCHAGFEYNVLSEISSYTYHFWDRSQSNSPIVAYRWDFGDSTISTKQNPEHQYFNEGQYVVALTVQTSDSCTSTHYDTIIVEKIVPPGCMAYFTYIYLQQSPSYTYAFTDHSVPANGDTIISRQWNFGDGSSSNIRNPIHQFMATGNYNVSLTINTTSGCISSYSFVIQIYNGSSPCQASFSATQDTTGNPLKYHFHDNSVHSTNIISWKWKFDDGDSSLLQDPDHIFPFAGVYFVSLEIKTSGGCSDQMSFPVQVGNPQPYNLWGRVYAGPYVIDKCIAYLYKEYNNDYYKAIDTVRLTSVNDTLGVYYFFQVPEGKHKVKVLLPDGSIYSDDYAPTYYGNKLKWKNGLTINLFQNIPMANVNLKQIIKTTGNCYIQGKINSNNTTANVKDIEMLLFDASGNLADYTFSDSLGNIDFGDLAKGTYYICGEVTGLLSNTISVSFKNNSDTISNLHFNINKTHILGILTGNNQQKAEFEVYPNPAINHLNVKFKNLYSSKAAIKTEIIDLQGKILWEKNESISTGDKLTVPVSNLTKGLYILKLTDIQSGNVSSVKFIKK